jgi:serine/threonine protein kinase
VQKIRGSPPTYAASEVIFKDPVLTPAVDVWSLGCVLFRLFSDHDLWDLFDGDDDTILSWVCAYGKLPEEWWGQ